MPTLNALVQRLDRVNDDQKKPLISAITNQLAAQDYQGRLLPSFVAECCQQFRVSTLELALAGLPIAACYALTPVSHFNVGAIAIGASGTFYFGANQEFAHDAIQQTLHAEQSAIGHAWLAGESRLTDIVVNYTPCGHCRQFMNELNSAADLHIHLPHCQHQPLHHYLPDAFGPKDLQIEQLLFDRTRQAFLPQGDPLIQAAIEAAAHAYAPYSSAYSGVALQCGERIITGRYAENAAFNPSFLPLQSALNFQRLNGWQTDPITRVVLAEKVAVLSSRAITASLAKQLFNLEIDYFSL
ncbi:cytidine deaminase [Muribacter muris]|uniref:Cytidine deaminase n=1 Tax=Muribacter muris TaxID=67855 RepID=A0A4Y9JQ28_9PAST|nr:cytidine deaminase [Muribacter muris]MBF0786184.1 cytidine deaminase [Muribacter muris]MBF0826695.1 cytidine deaminase [Muribacter muris]TFV07678.1 cytidine deaminase [Muribacter muris]